VGEGGTEGIKKGRVKKKKNRDCEVGGVLQRDSCVEVMRGCRKRKGQSRGKSVESVWKGNGLTGGGGGGVGGGGGGGGGVGGGGGGGGGGRGGGGVGGGFGCGGWFFVGGALIK